MNFLDSYQIKVVEDTDQPQANVDLDLTQCHQIETHISNIFVFVLLIVNLENIYIYISIIFKNNYVAKRFWDDI